MKERKKKGKKMKNKVETRIFEKQEILVNITLRKLIRALK